MKTPTAKGSAIQMNAGKEFFMVNLTNPDGVSKKLKGAELNSLFARFSPLTTPNYRRIVTETKLKCNPEGYADNIFKLKRVSSVDYIQDSVFPGQGKENVYLFKMTTDGDGSGVDLVKRMQPGGDLQHSWIMFDHVKRVKGWTTLACHVYDADYYKVMTIAVCDMQSETTAAQSQMWLSMKQILADHGVPDFNFKGFMADSAQANFNAVRIIFGSGDPSVPMVDRERTCSFHWTVSLMRHTKQLIKRDLQSEHIRLCKEYKNCQSMEEADTAYATIKAWWFSSGATSEEGMRELKNWLAFWHFRY